MLKKILLASGLAMITAAPAVAQQGPNGFSYTYGQLALESWEYDEAEFDAIGVEGSLALDDLLFVRGGLGLYDGENVDLDGSRFYGGLGFRTPLAPGLDFVGSADVIYDDNDVDDDIGFELRGGVRHATTAKLELSGGLSYQDIYDDDMAFYGQGLFKLTSRFNLGGRVVFGGDRENIGLFARYNF